MTPVLPATGNVQGIVGAFDDHRGIGEVITDDGTHLRFHCTAIADGTRTIAVGTEVDLAIVNGPLGDYEATELRRA
jgi:cold shock CspA family protein